MFYPATAADLTKKTHAESAKAVPAEKPIVAAVTSADGRYLATGFEDNSVVVWDMEAREVVRVLKGHGDVLSVEVRHDSARFLLTAAKGTPARRGEGRQGSREDIVVNGVSTALPANEEIVVDLIRTLR